MSDCQHECAHRFGEECAGIQWRDRRPPSLDAPDFSPDVVDCSNETVTDNGELYRGCQSKTVSGKICQKWTSQSPHLLSKLEHQNAMNGENGMGLGDHNYCRNPDGEQDDIWCYTTDPETRWEKCAPMSETEQKTHYEETEKLVRSRCLLVSKRFTESCDWNFAEFGTGNNNDGFFAWGNSATDQEQNYEWKLQTRECFAPLEEFDTARDMALVKLYREYDQGMNCPYQGAEDKYVAVYEVQTLQMSAKLVISFEASAFAELTVAYIPLGSINLSMIGKVIIGPLGKGITPFVEVQVEISLKLGLPIVPVTLELRAYVNVKFPIDGRLLMSATIQLMMHHNCPNSWWNPLTYVCNAMGFYGYGTKNIFGAKLNLNMNIYRQRQLSSSGKNRIAPRNSLRHLLVKRSYQRKVTGSVKDGQAVPHTKGTRRLLAVSSGNALDVYERLEKLHADIQEQRRQLLEDVSAAAAAQQQRRRLLSPAAKLNMAATHTQMNNNSTTTQPTSADNLALTRHLSYMRTEVGAHAATVRECARNRRLGEGTAAMSSTGHDDAYHHDGYARRMRLLSLVHHAPGCINNKQSSPSPSPAQNQKRRSLSADDDLLSALANEEWALYERQMHEESRILLVHDETTPELEEFGMKSSRKIEL
jgi:hypothetical protein